MPVSTLTAKGQITLPQGVRKALDLRAGDKVDFVNDGGGFRLVVVRADVRALKGRFAGRVSVPVTVEDMDAAVAEAAGEADYP